MSPGRDAFGLQAKQVIWLALMQCTIQGILVPLLATFLASKRDHKPWFRFYVVFVNILSLVQTVGHTIQGFGAIDPAPPQGIFVLLAPVLTGAISIHVQAFFIYRCWRIFNRRILPIVPFLLLSLVSTVGAILLGVYSEQRTMRMDRELQSRISLGVWVFSSFALDFFTTLTTVVYLYRVWKEAGDQGSILKTVWHVVWASATPPLLLMSVIIFDMYIFKTRTAATTLSAGVTAKFFVLSLMLNLVGQGYLRERINSPQPFKSGDTPQSMLGAISAPMFAPTGGTTFELELTQKQSSTSTQVVDFSRESHAKTGHSNPCLSQTTGLKDGEISTDYGAHSVKLIPEPDV